MWIHVSTEHQKLLKKMWTDASTEDHKIIQENVDSRIN